MEEWPSNIQDMILYALEKKSQEVELPLAIVGAACEIDYGDTSDKDKYYVRVIASEIVAKDNRFSDDDLIKKAVQDTLRTKH